MAKAPRLEPYDLETIRLGHFMALRQIHDGYGAFQGFSVIGQAVGWPRREASVAKLVGMGILHADPAFDGACERPLLLTENGERLYASFRKMEEDGSIRDFLAKVAAR